MYYDVFAPVLCIKLSLGDGGGGVNEKYENFWVIVAAVPAGKIDTTSESADKDKKERRVAKSGACRTRLRKLLTPPMNGKPDSV